MSPADVPHTVPAAVHRSVMSCPECAARYSADSIFCPYDGAMLTPAIWVAPTDPSGDARLGTVVDGRYRVERVLGEGGTGTVYEVLHASLGRLFAMKVLRQEVAADADLGARFIQEANATARLRHPHIVSITDFGYLPDKVPYFVMERLIGETLAQRCKAGPRDPERAVGIVLQVADALGAAHDAGLLHRDLKPENLFLVAGARDDVRVVDFGAAKIAGASRLTKNGIVFGTPHYMAPEQASGQPVDHRADIYAMGVIMYELFTGRLPFEADTLMGVLTKHMFVDPPRFVDAGHARPEARARLEAVTLRALAKRPEQRFQTMGELAAALAEASASASLATASAGRTLGEPSARIGPHDEVSATDLPVAGRSGLVLGGVVGVSAVVVALAVRGLAPRAPLPAAGSAPAVTSSTPGESRPPAIRVRSTPAFAEVWHDSRRIGTTPLDMVADAGSFVGEVSLRAPGFIDQTVDVTGRSLVDIVLSPVPAPAASASASPPAPGRPRKVPAPAASVRRPSPSDGELVDPFAR